MPRYKVLKSVAHNIGHTFTSLMNYSDDDYSMGHILRFALETGLDSLTIDFVTGRGTPAMLLCVPISELPSWYTKMFWDLVTRSGSDRALIQSATLTLKYDLQRSRSVVYSDFPEAPYTCDVTILDNRGKNYAAHFSGRWYVEKPHSSPDARPWWNPLRWLRG